MFTFDFILKPLTHFFKSLIFIREVLMKHGCTFSLRTYSDGLTRFRIRFSA